MILARLFRSKPKPLLADEDVPRYPPFVRGLPAVSEEELLKSQQDILDRIKQIVRCDMEFYRYWYEPALRRYARFVHLLPASETHHHRGQGGLLRHGFETAFWSLQASEDVIFGLDLTPRERRKVTPCYELAVFLAALGHDMGKPVSDMVISEVKGSSVWDPFTQDLVTWARKNNVERYFVRWRADRKNQHESMATLVINSLITNEVKSYLSGNAPGVLQLLLAAISGVVAGRNLIQELMQKGDRTSTEKDLRERSAEAEISAQVGVPIERNLLDAMRRLVKQQTWKVNEPGARVWMLGNALYVVWRQGTKEIIDLLAKDKIPAVPRDPESLADILLERNLAVAHATPHGNSRYWTIAPDILQKPGRQVVLSVLRLQSPELLIDPAPASIGGLTGVPMPPQPQAASAQPSPAPSVPTNQAPSANPCVPSTPAVPPNPPPPAQPVALPEEVGKPSVQMPKLPQLPKDPAIRPDPRQEPWLEPPRPEFLVEPVPLPPEPEEDIEAAAELILPQMGSQAAPAAADGAPPADSKEQAAAVADAGRFFEDAGLLGEVLKAVAEDLACGRTQWGNAAISLPRGMVALRYPAALEGYGALPKELLPLMDERKWLRLDPAAPLKKVQEVEGFGQAGKVKALLLEEKVAKPFLILARQQGLVLPDSPALRPAPPAAKPKTKEKAPEKKTESVAVDQKDKAMQPPKDNAPSGKLPEKAAGGEAAASDTDLLRRFLAEIDAKNDASRPLQKDGKRYIPYEEAIAWVMKEENVSRSRAKRILLDSQTIKVVDQQGQKIFQLQ